MKKNTFRCEHGGVTDALSFGLLGDGDNGKSLMYVKMLPASQKAAEQ